MIEPQYEVGKPYNPDRRVWTQGSDFNYRKREGSEDGMLELRLFYSNLRQSEIDGVKRGSATFGVAYLYETLFFLYKFGSGMIYGDCSFTLHLVPDEDKAELPELGSESFGELFVILVNADTGIVEAMRLIKLGEKFALRLYGLMLTDRDRGFASSIHNLNIAKAYHQYPTTDHMFKQATEVCTVMPRFAQN